MKLSNFITLRRFIKEVFYHLGEMYICKSPFKLSASQINESPLTFIKLCT